MQFPGFDVTSQVLIRSESPSNPAKLGSVTFRDFSMPASSSTDEIGIKDVQIIGGTVGLQLSNVGPASLSTGDSAAFIVRRLTINGSATGIRLTNADVPFNIEENFILGTGVAAGGSGIHILSSSKSAKPSVIGNFESVGSGNVRPAGTGNIISAFGWGIDSEGEFPSLRVSGNAIGPSIINTTTGPISFGPNSIGIRAANMLSGFDTLNMDQLDRIDNNVIQGNTGTAAISISRLDSIQIDHNTIAGNSGKGINLAFRSGNHTIVQNTFDQNGNDAISIQPGGDLGDSARSIRISQNQFFRNSNVVGTAPIDLTDDGAKSNDPDDNDEGINNLQNFPVIESSGMYRQGSNWHVPVQLDTLGQGTFRLQFYKYDDVLRSYTYIKEVSIFKQGGSDPFRGEVTFVNGTELTEGNRIAALAIDEVGASTISGATGSTSEMSPAHLVRQYLPKVVDVRLDALAWTRDAYSFATLVNQDSAAHGGDQSQQLRPIATRNVRQVQIVFSEHVRMRRSDGFIQNIDASVLELKKTVRNADGSVTNSTIAGTASGVMFSYDAATHTATWTFPFSGTNSLENGKYALHLAAGGTSNVLSVVDMSANDLDGEYDNRQGFDQLGRPSPDRFEDDPRRLFSVGNDQAGSIDSDGDGDEEFRLHFALLAGDYDGDGVVEHSAESATGDGDGDGDSGDAADLAIGVNGSTLPLRHNGADIFDDEIVDLADYGAFMNVLHTTDPRGDFNGDGLSDFYDFVIFQNSYESYSAWSVPSSLAAASSWPPLIGDAAPRVMNVIISGSISTHMPFSYDTVDGSGAQLRSAPVGGADTISIVFSEGVNISPESLSVIGMTTGNLPVLAAFSYDAASHTATWRYEGWALGDNYLLALSDDVTDIDGNQLDGEWVNPKSVSTVNAAVSEFPSGDGLPRGWFMFAVTLLPADANLDNVVDSTDANIWYSHWGQQSAPFTWGDYNGDGTVNTTDWPLYAANQGTQLQTLKLKADFDGDLDVDDADMDLIATNAGMTGATWADGDLNGDGEVTIEDVDLAYATYGWGIDAVS
jgi:hypothetical protein